MTTKGTYRRLSKSSPAPADAEQPNVNAASAEETEEQEREGEEEANNMDNTQMLSAFLRGYFFLSGQWFEPVRHLLPSQRFPQIACRVAYALWQLTVASLMWVFFCYSMGFFGLRTMKELDWLCPLTDLKNIAYALRWIVGQHTGLLFFLSGNFKSLLNQLSVKKAEMEKWRDRPSNTNAIFTFFSLPLQFLLPNADIAKLRCNFNTIAIFKLFSFLFLFLFPIAMDIAQTTIPDFMPLPGYRNGTITVINKVPFPVWQIILNTVVFTANRFFSLPIFFAFLHMIEFLCCEVELFREDLTSGKYPTEDKARERAIKIKKLIRDTESAFRFFLALYIVMLLVGSALEIFSIVEKVEIVISRNHTVYYVPSSTFTTSMATTTGLQVWKTPANLTAFPHGLTGKRSFPYMLVIVPPANDSTGPQVANSYDPMLTKTVIDQYKLNVGEIAITALIDITENVVLYIVPLCTMSALKSHLVSVVEAVEDSDYGQQTANVKIFSTRDEKQDFRDYFRDTCCAGIRVLGREVSFLWTLVITVFGPFVIVLFNLMFQHIHVEPPLH